MFVGRASLLLREVAMKQRQWNRVAFLVWALVLAGAGIRLGWLYAQEVPATPATSPAEKTPAAPKGSTSEGASVADELALEESKIADKYARLEQVIRDQYGEAYIPEVSPMLAQINTDEPPF